MSVKALINGITVLREELKLILTLDFIYESVLFCLLYMCIDVLYYIPVKKQNPKYLGMLYTFLYIDIVFNKLVNYLTLPVEKCDVRKSDDKIIQCNVAILKIDDLHL